MYQTECKLSRSTLYVDYDDLTNTIEIHVGNSNGFRFIHLDIEQTEELREILSEIKNQII